MKFATIAAAALLALASTSSVATAESNQEMWVAIFGYGNKDKFISKLVNLLQNPDSFPDDDESSGEPAEIVEWASKCVKGSYSAVNPDYGMDFEDMDMEMFKKFDMSQDEILKLVAAFMDLSNPDNTGILKKFYSKIFDMVKFEAKIFWVTDAETMAQPECQKNKLDSFFNSQPLFKDLFKVIKYEKVNMSAEQFKSCVNTETTSTGEEVVSAPVCGNESTAVENACVACSISNSVIASTMVAGAMIVASIFF